MVQELRVRRPTATSTSPRRCRSRATRSSTASGCSFWQRYGTDPQRRRRQGPAGRGGEEVRLRQRDRHRPAGGGRRPDRRPALEAVVLEVDEGLLLQDRRPEHRGQAGLPARLRPRVLPRGQLLPGRRRGELLHRPGRHARHAAAAGPRVRRPRPTAARSTSRGSARRSSARTAPSSSGSPRRCRGTWACRAASMRYVDQALLGTPKVGTHGLADDRLPARPGAHPVQDRLGRGLRQAVDVVGGVLRRELRGRDDGQPGRHRLGHLRARRSGRSGRRCTASAARPSTRRAPRSPGTTPPDGLPTFLGDGSILPPGRKVSR